MKSQEIDNLMQLVLDSWSFDQEHYAHSVGNTESEKLAFAAGHVNDHINESTGRISRIIGEAQHTGVFDSEPLRQDPRRIVVNGLRLAAVLGISAEELVADIHAWAKKYKSPTR